MLCFILKIEHLEIFLFVGIATFLFYFYLFILKHFRFNLLSWIILVKAGSNCLIRWTNILFFSFVDLVIKRVTLDLGTFPEILLKCHSLIIKTIGFVIFLTRFVHSLHIVCVFIPILSRNWEIKAMCHPINFVFFQVIYCILLY